MGYIKDGYEVLKDLSKGISKRQKVKRLIDNLMLAIDTNTIDEFFNNNYQILNDLIVKMKWKEKDKEYKEKYIRIREFHKKHQGDGAILI